MDKDSKNTIDSSVTRNRLKFAAWLTFFVLCIEVVGGILAHSLALLSDAAHMFTDVFSLTLSWFALKIACLPTNEEKTYGYHRTVTLAAIINGLNLALMACGSF